MIVEFDSNLNSKTKDLIVDSLQFYLDKLLPPHIVEELNIDIEFNSEMYQNGLCMIDEELENIGAPSPRNFIIYLKNKRENLLEVLAHEAVHIKQYATNELKRLVLTSDGDILTHIDVWQDRVWEPTDDETLEFDSPWEIEAYGREWGLSSRFRRHRKKTN